MVFGNAIADEGAPAERRTVVELAARYIRERGIAAGRIFTISALEFGEARKAGHAPAAWNELGALRDTLAAHADAHMQRLAERERRSRAAAAPERAGEASASPALKRGLGRLFGRPPRS